MALAALYKRDIQAAGEVQPGNPGERDEAGKFVDSNSADFGGIGKEARELAAEKFNVGKTAVDEAEQIYEKAPDLFEQMLEGNGGLREHQRTLKEQGACLSACGARS